MWNETLDQALKGTLMQQCPEHMVCQVVSPNFLYLIFYTFILGFTLWQINKLWYYYDKWKEQKKEEKKVTIK